MEGRTSLKRFAQQPYLSDEQIALLQAKKEVKAQILHFLALSRERRVALRFTDSNESPELFSNLLYKYRTSQKHRFRNSKKQPSSYTNRSRGMLVCMS